MLHYNGKLNITDKKYIISENFSLENELNATINGFYTPSKNYLDTIEHPQCRFPARLLFISHELNISKEEFPKIKCLNLDLYEMKTPADKISLIYASEKVNFPSSMMGHSFLKYSGKNYQNREVEHAASFYTIVDTVNLFKLAYKNIFSGMKGLFALQPYEKVVEQYTNIENRNIWEYQLSISDYRRKLIYYHVWELKSIRTKYFFTSYNCSTVIYYTLSLANPKIYNDEHLWMTPIDTVKFLYKYDLLEKSKFIPSNKYLIQMSTEDLNGDEIDISKYTTPNEIPNERQFGIGYSNIDKQEYTQLSFLAASHLLNDNKRENFGESELKIFNLSILLNKDDIVLEELTLYGMKSYIPYNTLTNDLSYQFELAVKKEYSEDMSYLDTFKIDGGVGIDFLIGDDINLFIVSNFGVGYNKDDKTHIFFNPQIGGTIYEMLNMKSLAYYQPLFINSNKIYDKYVFNHNIFLFKDYKLYFNFEKVDAIQIYNHYELGVKILF